MPSLDHRHAPLHSAYTTSAAHMPSLDHRCPPHAQLRPQAPPNTRLSPFSFLLAMHTLLDPAQLRQGHEHQRLPPDAGPACATFSCPQAWAVGLWPRWAVPGCCGALLLVGIPGCCKALLSVGVPRVLWGSGLGGHSQGAVGLWPRWVVPGCRGAAPSCSTVTSPLLAPGLLLLLLAEPLLTPVPADFRIAQWPRDGE